MNNDQLTIIDKRLKDLQKAADQAEAEASRDHEEMVAGFREIQNIDSELIKRVGALEKQVSDMEDKIKRVHIKIGNEVEEAVRPITETLDKVKKESWWNKHFVRR